MKGELIMKQDYEKPELVVYEELSDVTTGASTVTV
jgi:hypothetical protein